MKFIDKYNICHFLKKWLLWRPMFWANTTDINNDDKNNNDFKRFMIIFIKIIMKDSWSKLLPSLIVNLITKTLALIPVVWLLLKMNGSWCANMVKVRQCACQCVFQLLQIFTQQLCISISYGGGDTCTLSQLSWKATRSSQTEINTKLVYIIAVVAHRCKKKVKMAPNVPAVCALFLF